MNDCVFLNARGDFELRGAARYPDVYFPLVNEGGMISCVTPWLAGDCKTDQNHFLLAPASMETLRESRATRNFWVLVDGEKPWSAAGQSAWQQADRGTPDEDETRLTGGLLWQELERRRKKTGLIARTLSFVPSGKERVEIMQVTLVNQGERAITLTPVAAVPLYGRSADNLRDHRHVTSLLHRLTLAPRGAELRQTLTFDERGHKPGDTVYRVFGGDDTGRPPEKFVPRAADFIGQGSCDWPDAVVFPRRVKFSKAGERAQGGEMIAAMWFEKTTIAPGESRRYQIALAIGDDPSAYLTPGAVGEALKRTKAWWQSACDISVRTANADYDAWIAWVGAQPVLRRICGCSFLPHHDYGRGGRGWRDLWQDSLALLLSGPESVRSDLINYFSGVRADGTNATIIGAKPGEFKADRNNIPRVWMDHGFWPVLTTDLYLNETGDDSLLFEKTGYFEDAPRQDGAGDQQIGTVLEHMIVQTACRFFDAGGHGHCRLLGADWNDGLDMARERGESVAFTAAYAYALKRLSAMTERLDRGGIRQVALLSPLWRLIEREDADADRERSLEAYRAAAGVETERQDVPCALLAARLRDMAARMIKNIRDNEWVSDGAEQHWFNSYYDNDGQPLEGLRGDRAGMILTGQVFCLLAGVADDAQAAQIARAADWYLRCPNRGGYCLNTDFHEVKSNMGRMFGFAYGHKENGAVFCHMAVMYAYALYSRGLVAEGAQALDMLFRQSTNFGACRILPGIPEYFDDRGRGMYPYLTGAASWLMLTLRTYVFGVRGDCGDLLIEPRLTLPQFGADGEAVLRCRFAGHALTVVIRNPMALDWGEYLIGEVRAADRHCEAKGAYCVIPRAAIQGDTEIRLTLVPIE